MPIRALIGVKLIAPAQLFDEQTESRQKCLTSAIAKSCQSIYMPEMKYGPTSEVYKIILNDFMMHQQTGWKPFGKGIGCVDHYKSRSIYENTFKSRHSFRSLAQKIAKKAISLLPSSLIEDNDSKENSSDDDSDDDAEKKGENEVSTAKTAASKSSLIDLTADTSEGAK